MIDINKIQKSLNLKFNDKKLLIKALTHKSSNQDDNNEKLEFLGDRVIGLVLSKKLFDLYPNEKEGIIDKKFAQLVNRKTCCLIAWTLGLQNFILLGNSKKTINKNDEKILSDSCEALIGAIFIDKGYAFVKNFILKHWKKNISYSNKIVLDPKTELQEYSLKKFKKLPVYELLSSKGPKHSPTFKISVSINNTKKFVGTGRSKQSAELNGAKNLLQDMKII
tara:strand:- start:208 stop:873 length:666 start_codon:yes stop_codon:yes gene_type:complete